MHADKPYTTYIIESDNNRKYIGVSENVSRRALEHNLGLSQWTSQFQNWKIIYTKKFSNLSEARKWENYLKRQKGGNGLKKILEEYKTNVD